MDARPSPLAVAAVVLGAAGSALFQLTQDTGIGFGPGFEMASLARTLASQGIFGDPFPPAITGPSAVAPPLYPAILALALQLLSSPNAIVMGIMALNVFAVAATALLLPGFSVRLFGGAAPGWVAAVLWVGSTKYIPQWDAAFTSLLIVIFCRWTLARQVNAAQGLLAGAIVLANPAAALILAPWIAVRVWRDPAARRGTAALAAAAIAVPLPWMARNAAVLGAFTLRTNFGMTLNASNRDCAAPSLAESMRNGCHSGHHPSTSAAEAAEFARLGEVAYDRVRRAEATEWIARHPARFAALTAARVRDFWFPPLEPPVFAIAAIWAATALGFAGLAALSLRRHPSAIYSAAVLVPYPLLYAIVISDVRYRYPVYWMTALLAGWMCTAWRSK